MTGDVTEDYERHKGEASRQRRHADGGQALFGATPHQLRMRWRMDCAGEARGEHSVTDVCLELGYSSLGTFSAQFTQRVGESPSAYQRRARVMVQVPAALPSSLYVGCLSLMGALPMNAFRSF